MPCILDVGIPAHALLSTTHSDAAAAAVVRGAILVGNSTPAWSRLTIGDANSVLSSDGTDASWSTGPTVIACTIAQAVGAVGLTITGGTQTSSFPALSLTQTWNASGTTFTALKVNVTSTASAAASLLQDWQVGGASVATLDKAGGLHVTDGATNGISFGLGATAGIRHNSANDAGYLRIVVASGEYCWIGTGGVINSSTSYLAWCPGAISAASRDTFIGRPAAATIQFGVDVNGAAVAQTLTACNGITGTDKTGATFTIASGKGTGAGAVSSLIFQTPTVLTSGTTAQSLATRLTLTSAGLTIPDAHDLLIDATTGTKIGQSTSKLGFYGVTPIVRAILATGAGATVDNVITALQNLGLVKQS